jgi:hypothetical protein
MSLRHILDHNLDDCPAKQLIANNKGMLHFKLFSTKCTVLKRMAFTFFIVIY